MKKNNKGFTLVELLAVIAILAILIIIALPNILKLFNEAQMKIFLQEARNINKAAEDSYIAHRMSTSNPTETVYTYNDGEESSTGNIDVNIIGQKPQNGELIIMPNGETALAFHNGKYCARKILGSKEITISKVTLDQCTVDFVSSEECFITDPDDVVYKDAFGATYSFTYTYDNVSNGAVIYQYKYNNPNCLKNVVIPDTIDGKTVVAIEAGAFASGQIDYYIWQDMNIESVYMPNSIEYIGQKAFRNNIISNLTIPSAVTYIGYEAFYRNSLEEIVIPNNVTIIETRAFYQNQLTNATIGNSVTTIGESAFENNQLNSVMIGNAVTNIGYYAFQNNQLTSITIPNSVKTIKGSAFSSNQLTSITLSNGLETIEWDAFYNNQLTSVTIPTSVTTIGNYAFYNNNLTSVYIKGKSSSTGFASYGSGIWGWTTGYSDSNITWNAL